MNALRRNTACENHLWLMNQAQAAFELGARVRTVEIITGISRYTLASKFADLPEIHRNHGGMPTTPYWYMAGSVRRAQASHFYAYFDAGVGRGVSPLEMLIVAYRRYLARYIDDPQLTFDRAFLLAATVRSLWGHKDPSLYAVRCPRCTCLYISQVETVKCPFCQVMKDQSRTKKIAAPIALEDTPFRAPVALEVEKAARPTVSGQHSSVTGLSKQRLL